jgi:hypothetical protein
MVDAYPPGADPPWYYEWMRHPPGNAWWDFARLPRRYNRVCGTAVRFDLPRARLDAVDGRGIF